MAVRDDRSDVQRQRQGFEALIVLDPGSIKSKFLSLKKLKTAIYQRIFILG